MKHTLTLTAIVALSALAAAQEKPEPAVLKGDAPGHYPNGSSLVQVVGGSDNCAMAAANDSIMGVGSFAVNTMGATTGVAPQTASTIKNDVWFYWTATASGVARLETCNGVTVDTKAAAWAANNGTACPSGTELAYNDDACGLQTRITWGVTSGQTYFLQLGAFNEGVTYSGTFTLDILPPAVNDDCTAPITVVGNGPFPFDTIAATTGLQGQTEGLCGATTGIGRDVWYLWTSTMTGIVGASTCGGTTLDTKIAVYPASGCPVAGSALGCNDDSCGTQANASFNAVTGTTYLIQLGQDPTNTVAGGSGSFTFVDNTPPTNDSCATPIVIAGAGPFNFNNTLATTGVEGQNEALCLYAGTTAIRKDLWYTWTPTLSGPVTVSTCNLLTLPPGTSQDSKIAIYEGAGCPSAVALACNDDATCSVSGLNATVTFDALCGGTYTIQIGQFSSSLTTHVAGAFSIVEAGGGTCGPPAVPFCFGDGTGGACPCANTGAAGNGCASSVNAAGGNLTTSGTASIGADTLTLIGSGMPNSSALYFQGTATLNGGNGSVFGDGLRCAGGSVVRLGTKANAGGGSQYPGVGDQSVSVRGLNSAGAFRVYQIWYRNAAAFCTPSTFNLTNGVNLTWGV